MTVCFLIVRLIDCLIDWYRSVFFYWAGNCAICCFRLNYSGFECKQPTNQAAAVVTVDNRFFVLITFVFFFFFSLTTMPQATHTHSHTKCRRDATQKPSSHNTLFFRYFRGEWQVGEKKQFYLFIWWMLDRKIESFFLKKGKNDSEWRAIQNVDGLPLFNIWDMSVSVISMEKKKRGCCRRWKWMMMSRRRGTWFFLFLVRF